MGGLIQYLFVQKEIPSVLWEREVGGCIEVISLFMLQLPTADIPYALEAPLTPSHDRFSESEVVAGWGRQERSVLQAEFHPHCLGSHLIQYVFLSLGIWVLIDK